MYQQLATIVSTGIALGALTFQAGRHSETIQNTVATVATMEQRVSKQDDVLYEIHGKVCGIEKDIKHIRDNVCPKS